MNEAAPWKYSAVPTTSLCAYTLYSFPAKSLLQSLCEIRVRIRPTINQSKAGTTALRAIVSCGSAFPSWPIVAKANPIGIEPQASAATNFLPGIRTRPLFCEKTPTNGNAVPQKR